MYRISPLGALFAIVVIGITIEAVERQSRQAAYVLAIVVLLGIITFNAGAFTQQLGGIVAALNYGRSAGRGIRTRPKSEAKQGR